jgi:hypothetical protein
MAVVENPRAAVELIASQEVLIDEAGAFRKKSS